MTRRLVLHGPDSQLGQQGLLRLSRDRTEPEDLVHGVLNNCRSCGHRSPGWTRSGDNAFGRGWVLFCPGKAVSLSTAAADPPIAVSRALLVKTPPAGQITSLLKSVSVEVTGLYLGVGQWLSQSRARGGVDVEVGVAHVNTMSSLPVSCSRQASQAAAAGTASALDRAGAALVLVSRSGSHYREAVEQIGVDHQQHPDPARGAFGPLITARSGRKPPVATGTPTRHR